MNMKNVKANKAARVAMLFDTIQSLEKHADELNYLLAEEVKELDEKQMAIYANLTKA